MQLLLVATVMVMVRVMAHLLAMPPKISVLKVGVCLQVVVAENTKLSTLLIPVIMQPLLAPLGRLFPGSSTMVQRAIRARTAASGRLRAAVATACTTCTSMHRMSIPGIAIAGTTVTLSVVYLVLRQILQFFLFYPSSTYGLKRRVVARRGKNTFSGYA